MTPITTTAELSAFCKSLKGQPFIAVDTEFMRETTYWPKLCLIQVASPEHGACIDPMADDIDLTPLLDILRDPAVQKVFHAARQDVEIFNNLGAMPVPLFDTQIAGMAAGFGEQIAYDALVRQMLKIDIDKSSRFTDWARRPLSEAQLSYALADVTHLAKLYPMLRSRLEKAGRLLGSRRRWPRSTDPALYDVDPENSWKRLKPRKHTPEIPRRLQGRRRLARAHRPAARPAARAHPQGRRHRRTGRPGADRRRGARSPARGAEGLLRLQFGPDLLAAIREALKDPDGYAPVIERNGTPPNQAAGAIVELLKVLLKARSEDAGVASKLIATVSDLEKIANDDNADVQALQGWRREAFGADALKLKRGELALVLDGARVRVVEVRRAPRATTPA